VRALFSRQVVESYELKRNLDLKLTNRPLGELKEFLTTMVTDINDLPATSPHGSDFGEHE
jgi:hypothetical protein